ncbi:MAG: hypothetical protein Q9M31_04360 [Mariprofundus sp.]|nr:hypothetical protein [Mariprofundus sp.]
MKSEMSRNVLLISLAVRLQRLVKNLPNNHISAERISKKSLAEFYLSTSLAPSEEAARKKASRYMSEMQNIFGLHGSEENGFVMQQKFKSFREMFVFWLKKINPPGKNDKRLHVMLHGLIHAIDNAFSSDPIVVPDLAKKLKAKFGNRNIRDTNEPLRELFDNQYISSWLQLCELDDDILTIDTAIDPLLLRLKSRAEVGDNRDISIPLARPGRIHVIFDHCLSDLHHTRLHKVREIAEATANSTLWQINNERYMPYLLFREGDAGPIMLTMRNLSQNDFEDRMIDDLPATTVIQNQYIPFAMQAAVWTSFRQMAN